MSTSIKLDNHTTYPLYLKMKIDAREPESIQKLFPEATTTNLEIGDIASDDGYTIIERKEINDLAGSIIDGRYKDQIRTLIERNSFIIVVGRVPEDLSWRNRKGPIIKRVMSAMSSIPIKYRIPLFHVKDNKQFVKTVHRIFDKRKIPIDLDLVAKPRITNDPRLNVFLGLPDIGVQKAKQLLDQFGSFYSFSDWIKCDNAQLLQNIKGIGPKTISKIRGAIL